MSTATAYRSNFTGRFTPSGSRKSPEIKPFYGCRSAYSGQAHCIKDRVLLDPCIGSGGIPGYYFDVLGENKYTRERMSVLWKGNFHISS